MLKTLTLLAQGGLSLGIFTPEQQELISFIIDDILSFSIAFAVVNVAIFFPAVFRGLHRKIAASRVACEWENLLKITDIAVFAAHQSIDGDNHQLKYDFCVHAIDSFCKHTGMSLPNDDLKRVLIESSVLKFRRKFVEVNYVPELFGT